MERNRGAVVAIIAALVIAVAGLGVAFAAFQATLTINGNATIKASNWDVHFATSSQGAAPTTSANISNSFTGNYAVAAGNYTGVLTSQNFTWSANFKTPGDTVKYEFYIVNGGDYDATYSAPSVGAVSCSLSPCPVTYSITKDGSTAFSSSNTLTHGQSQKVVVIAKLNDNYGGNGSSLSGSDVSVTVPQVTFSFAQSGTAQ